MWVMSGSDLGQISPNIWTAPLTVTRFDFPWSAGYGVNNMDYFFPDTAFSFTNRQFCYSVSQGPKMGPSVPQEDIEYGSH